MDQAKNLLPVFYGGCETTSLSVSAPRQKLPLTPKTIANIRGKTRGKRAKKKGLTNEVGDIFLSWGVTLQGIIVSYPLINDCEGYFGRNLAPNGPNDDLNDHNGVT